jgi:hypothetical protein
MRRPKPQPKDTRLLRLRSAALPKRVEGLAHDHKSPLVPTPRLTRGRNFRLRKLRRD